MVLEKKDRCLSRWTSSEGRAKLLNCGAAARQSTLQDMMPRNESPAHKHTGSFQSSEMQEASANGSVTSFPMGGQLAPPRDSLKLPRRLCTL